MNWNVQIHKLVIADDMAGLSLDQQRDILHALYKKLTSQPEEYGKPLSGEFKGYWRLRVGDHRVIYRIIKNEVMVFVIKIGARKDDKVYREFAGRIRALSKERSGR